jgi:hypothetical protein
MSLIITRALVIITALVSIAILAAGRKKSNTAEQHKHLERWAIIGREYVEFDEDELRWRAGK